MGISISYMEYGDMVIYPLVNCPIPSITNWKDPPFCGWERSSRHKTTGPFSIAARLLFWHHRRVYRGRITKVLHGSAFFCTTKSSWSQRFWFWWFWDKWRIFDTSYIMIIPSIWQSTRVDSPLNFNMTSYIYIYYIYIYTYFWFIINDRWDIPVVLPFCFWNVVTQS